MSTDTITWWILLSPWLLWLPWEVYLLTRRRKREPGTPLVKLISGVARDRGWQMTGLVYAWCGMAGHWWWNAEWGEAWAGVTFWALLALLLIFDLVVWRKYRGDVTRWPRWLLRVRNPLWIGAGGVLAGRFLFPQAPPPWTAS